MKPKNANLASHPRCISGKNCVIAVDGGGCFLSRLHPVPLCIPCYIQKYGKHPGFGG